jgi:integrase
MPEPRNPIASDRLVASLPLPEKGQRIFYDGDIPGFGVRVTSGGAKTFILNYRVRGSGRERRYSIGAADRWKVSAARKEAERLRNIIDLGGDPLGDLEAGRQKAAEEKLKARTVAQLCERFEAEHLPSLRPTSRKFYRLALKNHIKPAIGAKRVEAVTQHDIEKLHGKLTDLGQRHQANQSVTLAGVLFKYAIKWGWRTGDNPARDIDRHTLEGRERYLSPAETKRLSAAIDQLDDRQAAAIMRILMLTGARIGETLRMRWEQIDFQRGTWVKPAGTTKQKKIHRLPLTAPVLAILSALRDEQDAARQDMAAAADSGPSWVFRGKGKDGHRTDLRGPWETALKAAQIAELRIHDLRHSFASTLAGGGYSLPMIGAALGHSRVETTQRYAHLADDPLRQAMTRGADLIEAAIKGDSAEVIRPFDGERTAR